MNRFYHLLFLLLMNIYLGILTLYVSLFGGKKTGSSRKKILALPYYPLHYAGGHTRIANWKPFFEKENIEFEVHWASETESFLNELMSNNWQRKYWFYAKVLTRRFLLFFRLKQYDVVWIQRAFVPFFPFKDAYFEKLIARLPIHFVIDFYDADYKSNYHLTLNAAKAANRVSVASIFLSQFFEKNNIKTHFVRYAMNYEDYIVHEYHLPKTNIIIGWMGAPNNFENVLFIEETLLEIEQLYPQVAFHFICRELMPLKLKRYKQMKWGDTGFDYQKAIAQFDIGIAPMIHATERDKAKTAFKTLEYMAAGLPMIVSPWGISDILKHEQNCIFAHDEAAWKPALIRLIEDVSLRSYLGKNARNDLEKFHAYDKVFPSLFDALIN